MAKDGGTTNRIHGTGIFTYIDHWSHKNQLNVGKYTIHGSYGLWDTVDDSANPAPNGRFSKSSQNCH